MQCPFCKASDTRVVDSRMYADGAEVRRRRECPDCERRFTTHERAELDLPAVQKNGGAHEAFSEHKLRDGVERALYKRPVTTEAVDRLVEQLIERMAGYSEREIPTSVIGKWVMEELSDIDQVAYVRFASVYRKFQDVNAFRDEIERLERTPSQAQKRSQLSFEGLNAAHKGRSD